MDDILLLLAPLACTSLVHVTTDLLHSMFQCHTAGLSHKPNWKDIHLYLLLVFTVFLVSQTIQISADKFARYTVGALKCEPLGCRVPVHTTTKLYTVI